MQSAFSELFFVSHLLVPTLPYVTELHDYNAKKVEIYHRKYLKAQSEHDRLSESVEFYRKRASDQH